MTPTPVARTLPGFCAENALARPAQMALVDDAGARLTHQDLHEQSIAFARGLQGLGVRRGDTVALLAPNRVEWVVSALGAHRAGAQVAAFHTWVKPYDLDFLLSHSEASTFIVAAQVGGKSLLDTVAALLPEVASRAAGPDWVCERYPALRRVIVLGETLSAGAHRWESVLSAGQAPASGDAAYAGQDLSAAGQVAFVLYTSGSTADPKGVPLLQGDMVDNGFQIGERMGLTEQDLVWLGSPLFWSFGSANALTAALTHGAALVLQEKFDAPAAARQIAAHGCTAAYLLPALVHAFSEVPDIATAFGTVRTGLTIGRPDEVETVATTLGVPGICNVYGATENYGNCCVTPHDMPLADKLLSQGPPLPGVEVRIVDPETGDPLPVGSDGEVEVRGRITPGYWKAPELNTETFRPDGWYRTGDIGRLDAAGCFRFVTRHSDMIKTSGINVSPAEVEVYLRTDPAVAEVVVVGAPDPVRGEVVVAFVRAVEGRSLDPEALLSHCRAELAGYKVPRQIRVVEQMPQTATGKLSRKQLREMLAAGYDPVEIVAGSTVDGRTVVGGTVAGPGAAR